MELPDRFFTFPGAEWQELFASGLPTQPWTYEGITLDELLEEDSDYGDDDEVEEATASNPSVDQSNPASPPMFQALPDHA